MSKQNPRKRPASMADVRKAKQEALDEAVSATLTIFLTVLLDKEGADIESLKRVWGEVNDLSDSIANGYVKLADLRRVLNEEYDILV